MFTFAIHGRGGQGVETLSGFLGRSAVLSGLQAQSMAFHTPEMRGHPTFAFVRADKDQILSRGVPESYDYTILMDQSLGLPEIIKACGEQSTLIVNSTRKVSVTGKKKVSVLQMDATALGIEHLKKPIPNTVLFGLLVKIFPKISAKSAKLSIEEFGTQVQENSAAFDAGFRSNVKVNK